MGKQDLKAIFLLVVNDMLINTDQRDIRGQPLIASCTNEAPSFLKIKM